MQTSNLSWRKLLLLDMNYYWSTSQSFPNKYPGIGWVKDGDIVDISLSYHCIQHFLCCIHLYPIYESVWEMIGSILTCEDEIGVTYPKLYIPRCWKQRTLSDSGSLVAQTFLTQLPLSPCCIFRWGDNRFFSSYWQAEWQEPQQQLAHHCSTRGATRSGSHPSMEEHFCWGFVYAAMLGQSLTF